VVVTWAFELKFSGAVMKVNASSKEMLPLSLLHRRATKTNNAFATSEKQLCTRARLLAFKLSLARSVMAQLKK
jgi:hypothetical protein